jgi:hypothetical protein
MPMAVRSKPVLRSVTDKPPIARWRINLVGESLVSFSFRGLRPLQQHIDFIGAPRSMKMGTTLSPCPYDVVAHHTTQ